jgi:23S rRNA (guanosine2251-2'-O)-methyltransferase
MLKKKGSPQLSNINIIYGLHPVLETINAGKRKIEEVFISKNRVDRIQPILNQYGIRPTKVDPSNLNILTRTEHHQGLAARVGPFPYAELEDLLDKSKPDAIIILLDEIQDPVNLGNIIRIGECLGASGVVLPNDRSVSITAVVEKASAGATAYFSVTKVTNLVRAIEQLKSAGFWMYAAEAKAERQYFDVKYDTKIGFILGSEGKGIRRLVREHCDNGISIPMKGKIDSLNVSQATSILLSEVMRQKSS